MKVQTPPNQQGLFNVTKQQYIELCRDKARELLQTRAFVTSDDITEQVPRPKWIHPNTTGGIFQHPDFQMVGVAIARKPSSNGRLIRKWGLKNPPVLQRWHTKAERDSD